MLDRAIRLIAIFFLSISFSGCSAQGVAFEYVCSTDRFDERLSRFVFSEPIDLESLKSIYLSEDIPSATREQLSETWVAFLSIADDSDCLYTFNSHDQAWRELRGVRGYAAAKDGQVVDIFILERS